MMFLMTDAKIRKSRIFRIFVNLSQGQDMYNQQI